MSRAILTIDDAPSAITPRILDYLHGKGITPVVNFIGAKVDEYFSEAVYVAKKGIVIGNHSFSHPEFSSITLSECRDEIIKTEHEINRVYDAAGVKREHRVFRFPYGDKGGAQAAELQKMLRDEFAFDRLDDTEITFPIWKKYHLDTDTDMMWTFDFVEYQLAWNNGFTWDSIVNHIHDEKPVQGDRLLGEGITNIILMHDMEETNAFMDRYYEKLIDYVMSLNVEFIEPKFIAHN